MEVIKWIVMYCGGVSPTLLCPPAVVVVYNSHHPWPLGHTGWADESWRTECGGYNLLNLLSLLLVLTLVLSTTYSLRIKFNSINILLLFLWVFPCGLICRTKAHKQAFGRWSWNATVSWNAEPCFQQTHSFFSRVPDHLLFSVFNYSARVRLINLPSIHFISAMIFWV